MSNADATVTVESPMPRKTLLAWFMLRFATPLTTGLFLVSTVSGVALFFHPYYAVAVVANLALIAAATVLEPTARRVLGI